MKYCFAQSIKGAFMCTTQMRIVLKFPQVRTFCSFPRFFRVLEVITFYKKGKKEWDTWLSDGMDSASLCSLTRCRSLALYVQAAGPSRQVPSSPGESSSLSQYLPLLTSAAAFLAALRKNCVLYWEGMEEKKSFSSWIPRIFGLEQNL